MKKILIGLPLIALIFFPWLLPMPVTTSSVVAQYELGGHMTFDVTAWNLSPLARTITSDHSTDIVLVIDGAPVAALPTSNTITLHRYDQLTRSVTYAISARSIDGSPRFNSASRQVEVAEGKHKIAVQWLGGTSFSQTVAFVRL